MAIGGIAETDTTQVTHLGGIFYFRKKSVAVEVVDWLGFVQQKTGRDFQALARKSLACFLLVKVLG